VTEERISSHRSPQPPPFTVSTFQGEVDRRESSGPSVEGARAFRAASRATWAHGFADRPVEAPDADAFDDLKREICAYGPFSPAAAKPRDALAVVRELAEYFGGGGVDVRGRLGCDNDPRAARAAPSTPAPSVERGDAPHPTVGVVDNELARSML
jgi:hypothetical protein